MTKSARSAPPNRKYCNLIAFARLSLPGQSCAIKIKGNANIQVEWYFSSANDPNGDESASLLGMEEQTCMAISPKSGSARNIWMPKAPPIMITKASIKVSSPGMPRCIRKQDQKDPYQFAIPWLKECRTAIETIMPTHLKRSVAAMAISASM